MKKLRYRVISIISNFVFLEIFFLLIGVVKYAQASDYFRVSALELVDADQQVVDLDIFSQANGQLPGSYYVAIFLNGVEIETRNIIFVKLENNQLSPRLTQSDLSKLGVNIEAFSTLRQLPIDEYIYDISKYIPHATAYFDFDKQRLELSIPQIALKTRPMEFIDPRLWNQGITAFLMSYDFSGSNADGENNNNQNYYANIRSGLNVVAWRLRNYSVYSSSTGGASDENSFSSINTYIQRDIHRIKGQMIVGQTYTPADIFDSFQFTGAQLLSDDDMLPNSLRGFAPVVRGIAQSNARITIRQNSYIIYENYVPPGPFEITDLYPTSASGDMEVTITENNGKERKFIQPLSSVPIMQRPGQIKYQFSLGRYRSSSLDVYQPSFGQVTLIYGLPNEISLYGGTQFSENYYAINTGIGMSLGDFGAMAVDTTLASAELSNGKTKSGNSYRFQYSKGFISTGTSLTLAEYRYSTSSYYSFSEANESGWGEASYYKNQKYNKRSRFQLTLNQSVSEYSSLYLSAWQQNYWGESYDRMFAIGYNISYNGISYSLNLIYNDYFNSNKNEDKQISFNVSIPLDKWLSNSWATFSTNSSDDGKISQQVALSGIALEDNNLSYNVSGAYGNKERGTEWRASLAYKGTSGSINTGYSYSDSMRQIDYGLSGGVVVHKNGVTLSQPLGETVGLIEAIGTIDNRVANHSGIKTDERGYAVIPHLQPYEKNRIILDTETLKDGVDIGEAVQIVVPTRGAIVNADYHVKTGYRVLVTLMYKGKLVPFGASASLSDNSSSGIVGENGELYLSGVPEKTNIKVQWGKSTTQQCQVRLILPSESDNGIILTKAQCN